MPADSDATGADQVAPAVAAGASPQDPNSLHLHTTERPSTTDPDREPGELSRDGPTLTTLRAAWQETGTPVPGGTAEAACRTARWVGPIIVGLFLAGDLTGSLTSTPTAIIAVACMAVLLLTVVMRPRESLPLIVALTVASLSMMSLTDGGEGSPDTPVAAAWFDTAAVAAALGMATLRRSVIAVAVVAATAAAGWGILALGGGLDGGWRTAVAWPTATLGLGLALAMTAAILRQVAAQLDSAQAVASTATTEAEVEQAADNTFHHYTRLLHDTAINTLGAVGQGVPEDSLAVLADRCEHDLAQLAGAQPDAPDDLIGMLRSRAVGLGIPLVVSGDIEALEALTPEDLSAAVAAFGEALVNTSKHAGATAAHLSIEPSDDSLLLSLSDDGHGWDGAFTAHRGIGQSIIGRAADAGITATVETAVGHGTVVRLLIGIPDKESHRLGRLIPDKLQAIGAAGCGAILIEVGIRTGVGIGFFPGWGSVTAFLLLTGTLLMGWFGRTPGRLPLRYAAWGLESITPAAVVILLPEAANGSVAWGWWATICCLVIFAALLLADAGWPVLVITYLLQAGARILHSDYPGDILTPDLLLLAIAGVVLWMVRTRINRMVLRNRTIVAELRRTRQATLSALASRRAGGRRLRQATTAARDMLQRLADGTADPSDPAVRAWCADEARYLRSVSRLGAHLAAPDLSLLALITQAHRAGIAMVLTVDARMRLPTGSQRTALEHLVRALRLDLATIGSSSLSLLRSGPENSLLLVTESTGWPEPTGQLEQARSTGMTTYWISEPSGITLEVVWREAEVSTDRAATPSMSGLSDPSQAPARR